MGSMACREITGRVRSQADEPALHGLASSETRRVLRTRVASRIAIERNSNIILRVFQALYPVSVSRASAAPC